MLLKTVAVSSLAAQFSAVKLMVLGVPVDDGDFKADVPVKGSVLAKADVSVAGGVLAKVTAAKAMAEKAAKAMAENIAKDREVSRFYGIIESIAKGEKKAGDQFWRFSFTNQLARSEFGTYARNAELASKCADPMYISVISTMSLAAGILTDQEIVKLSQYIDNMNQFVSKNCAHALQEKPEFFGRLQFLEKVEKEFERNAADAEITKFRKIVQSIAQEGKHAGAAFFLFF